MKEVERETTKIAKRMARDAGQSEAMWQLFLTEAYREYYGLTSLSEPTS